MSKSNNKLSAFLRSKQMWSVISLLLLLLFNLIFNSGFFAISINNGRLYGNIIDVLNRGAALVIVAIGMMLVISTAGIDISVGAVSAIGAMSAAFVLKNMGDTGMYVFLAILVGLMTGLASGLWNGLLVSRLGIQPMIATLILMTAGRGLAQIISNGEILTISNNSSYSFLGRGTVFGVPFPTILMIAIVLLIYLLTRKTALGMMIESIGVNETSSRYAGVNTTRIKWLCYIICGICAALAGMMNSANVSSADGNNNGLWMELDAILAVVLGGTSMAGGRFSIFGTVIGAIFIQTLTTTIYSFNVPSETILVVKAVVVVIVILLSSEKASNLLKKAKSSLKSDKEAV